MAEYITLPLVGALIGYGTNWLAIKMVFRPYEEKRVFGLKVPFTPGVMAKERYVFSKKLGNTLSDNVITDEELSKYFQNIDFSNIVKNLLDDVNVDKPLSTFIKDDKVVQALKISLKDLLSVCISKEDKANVAKAVVNQIKTKFDKEHLEKFLTTEEQIQIINSFKNNDEVFKVANSLITSLFRKVEVLEQPLKEVFSEDVIAKVLESLDGNKDKIRLGLLNYVKSEDFGFLEEKLGELVAQGVEKIPMAAMFGGSALGKMVTPILIENIVEYLEDEENNEEIVEVINNLLETLLKTDTKEALDFISQDIVYMSSQKLIVETCNSLTETVTVKNTTFEYKKIFTEVVDVLELKLESLIVNSINSFMEDNDKLEKLSDVIVESVLSVKANKIIGNINSEMVTKLGKVLESIVNKNLGLILQQINISEIVENKINTFELSEAERLVVGVMNKELKMITNLGGVLGFIIGCLSIFL